MVRREDARRCLTPWPVAVAKHARARGGELLELAERLDARR